MCVTWACQTLPDPSARSAYGYFALVYSLALAYNLALAFPLSLLVGVNNGTV